MSETTKLPTADIIDLKVGERANENGEIVLSHIRGRWRNASYERRKAELDTKRVKVEQAGKERL